MIDQVYLGFVINLGLVGAFAEEIRVKKEEWRAHLEKFNGKKIELWKLKMEDLLVDKEQWIVVDPDTQPTGTPSTIT